jgi:hypothetical protein
MVMVKDLKIALWLAAGAVLAQTGNVADCTPCRFALRAGEEQSVRFEWTRAGSAKKIAALVVGGQRLEVRDTEELGAEEAVFFDAPDINFDGVADLQVIVERGMPNARAMYWVYEPAAKRYEAVGVYPVFTLDAKRKLLTAYVKKGPAGRNSTRSVYAWRRGKLVRVGAKP